MPGSPQRKSRNPARADAIYPGYGFLSENPALAEACAAAGITFVGPSPEALHLAGNKVQALAAARSAAIPTLRSTPASTTPAELLGLAREVGFPLFVKATAGGGGRGLRRVDEEAGLDEAIDAAMREAASAFGDRRVFLEQAVRRPRHLEVQVLADRGGEVVHLYERDCSVQRRHQKVIEVAPAQNLDPAVRAMLCDDAVRFAQVIRYENAGTVEFLLGEDGRHVFIEMNPRIQVEHTVTEEVTGVDLVQAQFLIAGARVSPSSASLRMRSGSLARRSSAGSPPRTRPTTSARIRGGSPATARLAARGSGWTAGRSPPGPRSFPISTRCS